jgi:tripartite-type tricarboxylate transporter receptor subunit TctC
MNVSDFADLSAKSKSGKRYLTAVDRQDSLSAMAARQVAKSAGLTIEIVEFGSYAGAAEAVLKDVADLACVPVSDAVSVEGQAKLVLLGVTGRFRDALVPQLPTFGEQGVGNVATADWIAVAVDADLPADRIVPISSKLLKISGSDAFRTAALRQGLQAIPVTPPNADRYWRQVSRLATDPQSPEKDSR